jgi:hypothetical protein
MQYLHPPGNCRNCYTATPELLIEYPIFRLGYTLCKTCQEKIGQKLTRVAEETVLLYFALRDRRVPAELDKFDGSKRIDIAVARSRVNIEIDGSVSGHRVSNSASGFLTLRIPGTQVRNNLAETTYYVEAFLKESSARI